MKEYKIIFWDFDGVIKETVAIKTVAFAHLFKDFGDSVVQRVSRHHEANGGMPRYEKIPIYLEWAGIPVTNSLVDRYCQNFSLLVKQAVIDSPWVPGAREYLESNQHRQRFVLITATPGPEIEDILVMTGIRSYFEEVYGAPTKKGEAVASVLQRWQVARDRAVVVGDAATDRQAALENGLQFVLRITSLNSDLQRIHTGMSIENFLVWTDKLQ